MAEHDHYEEEEHKKGESLLDKIHSHDDDDSSLKAKVRGIFGRESNVHNCLGGGKPVDIFLRRDKKESGAVLGGITALYVLFELLGYHLLTLICHISILALAVLFLWSNASAYIKKS